MPFVVIRPGIKPDTTRRFRYVVKTSGIWSRLTPFFELFFAR
jgi:hypothetical protein